MSFRCLLPRYGVALLLLVSGSCGQEENPLRAEPLDWNDPIFESNLGIRPDPRVEGLSLREIVSSEAVVWPDGEHLCSTCHYRNGFFFYKTESERGSPMVIQSNDKIDGRTWALINGWGRRFYNIGAGTVAEKPDYLRVVVKKWLDDGKLDAQADQNRATEPLHWDSTIRFEALGYDPSEFIAGVSIDEVINSEISGRPDGFLCSRCHYKDAEIGYRPDIAKETGGTDFGPDTVIDGRSWSGAGGWASRFVALGPGAHYEKPAYLRDLFSRWRESGEQ